MNQTVPGGRSYDVINGLIGTTNSMHAGSHICTSQQLQPPVAAQLTEAGARLINDINAAALEAIDTLPTPKDDPCPALPILPSSWMQFIKAGSSGQKSTPKTACNPLATIIADFLMTKPGTRPRRRGEEYTPEELRPLPPDPFSHNAPAAPVPVMLSSAMDGQYVNQPLDVFSGESHLWFQSPPPLFAHAMSTLSHNQFNMDQGIPYFWENRTEPSSSISAGSDSNESAYRDTSDFIVHDPGDMLCWQ
ncbi:hypothetical protein K474DRAFT_1702969 [Panus rudis PR-1116 ss-1]|nr:hypothetical protein K474DRAFT_1702969 [Panus rudis PR-1116 ss-1]